MGGRLIDYIAQGNSADIPLAADMPARIALGGASIYYEQDTGSFRFFNSNTVAWDTFVSQTDEHIQDMLATFLVQGAGITLTYNDGANTLTIDCSITQYTNENAMDAIAAMLAAGAHTGITVTYNDAGDAMSLACTLTQYTDEMAQDAIAALIAAGVDSGLSISYNDVGDAISFSVNIAADTDIWGGTNDTKFVTPKRLKDWRTPVSVADAATITLDGSTGVNFYITLGGTRILANPTNFNPGQFGVIHVTQDGTGTRLLTFGVNWKFGNISIAGNVLSVAAGATDAIHYYVRADGTITCFIVQNLTGSPARLALDNLSNVNISSPTNGQVLTYDNATGKWKNAAAAGGGSSFQEVLTRSSTASTSSATDSVYVPVGATLPNAAAGSADNLSVTFTIGSTQNVLIQFGANLTRNGGFTRVVIRDSAGGAIWPVNAGVNRVYSRSMGENNYHDFQLTGIVNLAAGTYTFVVFAEHAITTPAVVWYDRFLRVRYI